MLVLPAIDLQNGRCVRLRQGLKDSATVYSDNPIEMAATWRDAGARMLHLVNLDGAFDDDSAENVRIAEAIVRRLDIPVQFGGGVRSEKQVASLVEIGVARIVLGTVAVERPDLLETLVARFGGDRIVVGIDAKDGLATTHGWETTSTISAVELGKRVAAVGVRRIVYTDVSRDGMLTGPNLEQTHRVAEETGLFVTASGGISSLDDLRRIKALEPNGVDSCIVGRALYEQCFTLPEALACQ